MDTVAQITSYIEQTPGWKGEVLKKLREVIHQADPEITEEWKWSTPVYSHNGQVCALGSFSDHVKINFFKGAALVDKAGLFNAGLDAKLSRAIDIVENDTIDEEGIRLLVQEAVALNLKGKKHG